MQDTKLSLSTLFLVILSFLLLFSGILGAIDFRTLSIETLWTYIVLLFCIVWIVFFRRFSSPSTQAPVSNKYPILLYLAYSLTLILIIVSGYPLFTLNFFKAVWPKILGFIMVFDWIILFSSSQYQFYRTSKKIDSGEIGLVTDGIYRLNRHPYYWGLISLSLSSALVFNSLFGFAGSVVLIVLLCHLAKMEEAHLTTLCADAWDKYRRNTPGFYFID